MLGIINAAAEAYRGVIPADCWHEPYMSSDSLAAELCAGVEFWGCEEQGVLIGVMGTQSVRTETSVVLANPPLGSRAR